MTHAAHLAGRVLSQAPSSVPQPTGYQSSERGGAPATSAVISPSEPPITSGAQCPGMPAKCAIRTIAAAIESVTTNWSQPGRDAMSRAT